MALNTRKASRVGGMVNLSGELSTGQVPVTAGGSRSHTALSGTAAAGGIQLWSGSACRLDSLILHSPVQSVAGGAAASGQTLVFYDRAIAVSGGIAAFSGTPLAVTIHPAPEGAITSATWNSGLTLIGRKIDLGIPFYSGLCAESRSGQIGWTALFTPSRSGD